MSKYQLDKDKIIKNMKAKGFNTQSELAKSLDISKNQLSLMLSSKFNPIKSNVIKLCEKLDVPVEEILVTQSNTQLSFFNTINEPKLNKDNKNISNEFDEFIDIENIKANKPYTCVELFAGAGGLAIGLEDAGFNSVGLVELDKNACHTLSTNRPNWNVIEEDIVKVAEEGIRKYIGNIDVDLLSGGYPCQSFSYAGKRLGLNDVRGTMFYYYAKILEQLNPKVFLAENVKGLLTDDNGRTLQTMIDVFSDLGYSVKYKLLNAWDYGVSQKRERLFIIGVRNDININYRYPKKFDYKPTLKDALKDVPKSVGSKYPEKKKLVLDLVPPGGCWVNLPEDIAKEYMGKSFYSGGGKRGMARRISWDEPCLTLTCSPAQKQTERCHPDETRPFTVREYARIQSFPDTWDFPVSISSAYKQIGNAVPCKLGKAVGLSLVNILNNLD